jgi:hypothetical protein
MERSVGELSREVAIEPIKDEWAGKERLQMAWWTP